MLLLFLCGFVNVCVIYQLRFNQIRVSVLKEGTFEKTDDLGFYLLSEFLLSFNE